MLSEKRKQEIARRAQSDAQALRSGWPVQNPYTSASESDEWQKQFDLAVAKSKNKGADFGLSRN